MRGEKIWSWRPVFESIASRGWFENFRLEAANYSGEILLKFYEVWKNIRLTFILAVRLENLFLRAI